MGRASVRARSGMPPKKRQQHKANAKSDAKAAPKLQISADNERRLRRLLLNTERPAPPPPAATALADTASRAQKAKRLRSVYDKLSLEGFSADQIEQALSALKVIFSSVHVFLSSFHKLPVFILGSRSANWSIFLDFSFLPMLLDKM